MIQRTIIRPQALYKWEEAYYYTNFDWPQIFQIPYKVNSDTQIQSMQYQILNRYFPTKHTLSIWYKNHDKKCEFCTCDEETLEHYFYDCADIKALWKSLMTWFKSIFHITFPLGRLDIIFGIMNNHQEPVLKALNYCILFGKLFIRKQKMKGENNFTLKTFLIKLSKRLETEKYIAMENDKVENFDTIYGQLYEKCLDDGFAF